MNDSMINPSVVDLKKKTGDRYSLVVVTSKRARQIIAGDKPLIDIDSHKSLTIAINELDQDKINFNLVNEGIK
ncbi:MULTISPECIES: DNA-directed RNA polymerase subunit omega [Clostridium]|uniref:DNA-directed RNA polymerase subunit omega n=1 Tax=Clostridium TaxID=1485 RepID=UPI0008252D37|nr:MULTISPECIES: DNA-directed RNA polymerase subunit omega [Clostridium]PJI06646.1 DNA-directed RNA polymerase subunit omega [Clostridium sp. CT7]